jgi:SpoVK/Ycf46/Vps4 family AAA+-type ATPase
MATRTTPKVMVRHIKPTATWDQLAGSRSTVAELKKLTDDVSSDTNSVMLFAGASGTGKTLAAEVIAKELSLDLMRVDLSAVVSKYIGETEKNLASVFAAAEQANAVLLLDEADALFGKRTDVKDSHDRYANMEVSYLLQHMETYSGIAILATNRKENIDAPFLRRFQYVVEFSVPLKS